MQVSRPVARLRRSRFIPSAAYTDHTQLRFGRQVTMMKMMRMVMKRAIIMMMMIVMTIFFKEVNNLHLCVIEQDLGRDGFYTTIASV